MFREDLDAASVSARLGLGDDFTPWLEDLELVGPSPTPVHLPDPREISDLFAHLGILPQDATEIIDAWLTPNYSPEMWWLLQRCHQQLVSQMGKPQPLPHGWKPLPSHLGTLGRVFFVYVFLATLPAVRQYHRERGIPDDISWATLADLGEHLAIHRRIFGTVGIDVPNWFPLHFRGILYRLGRLQFEQWRVSPKWPIYDDVTSHDMPEPRPTPGAPALALHIPESGGPMDPAACDESIERARNFFACHFPEETYRFARCASWLLDPQLADYLPPTSNIIRFQRRFHIVPGGTDCDQDVMRFVFRRVASSLDELPQRTTLQRVIVEHLRAGRHWQYYAGWFAL